MTPDRSRFAAAALAVAALSVAGCQPAGTTLTQEEFVEQGNAICAAGNAEIMASIPMDASGPPTGEEGEAVFQRIMTIIADTVDDVDALEGPPETEAEVDAIVADTRAIHAEVMAAGSEAFFASEEDPFAAVNPRLEAVGLTVCAEDPTAEE